MDSISFWISQGLLTDTHRIPEPPGSQSKFTVGLLLTGAGAGSNTAPMDYNVSGYGQLAVNRTSSPIDYTTSHFLTHMDGYPIVTYCYNSFIISIMFCMPQTMV